MNSVMIDLWPYLFPALLAGIAGLVGWVHNLRTRVAILEYTVEKQQERLDSHSKKQDEFVDLINDLRLEMVKQISGVSSELNTIATDVRSINRMFRADDEGITIKRSPRNNKKD